MYIHYTETNVHLWIYECASMDLRMYIYGSTNVYLWIYECAIVDEQTLRHRNNGAIPLCRAKDSRHLTNSLPVVLLFRLNWALHRTHIVLSLYH